MTFDEIIEAKWKRFDTVNRKRVRYDKKGDKIEIKFTPEEFKALWEPFRGDHRVFLSVYDPQSLVICRKDDIGHYAFDNVRIDTRHNNLIEAKMTLTVQEKEKIAMHASRLYSNKTEKQKAKMLKAAHSKKSAKKRAATFKEIKHQQGESNNQFGSYWITDGTVSSKWRDELGDVPLGFRRGRTVRKAVAHG